MSIFKAYDIRGVYPKDLNEDIARKIGAAFVQFTKVKQVAVGHDMRPSSPKLFKALAEGITSQGADVVDLGLCSTPMSYFALGQYKYESGIMITASHNPAGYNGMKLSLKDVIPISGDTGIQDIKKLVEKGDFKEKKKGKIIKKEFFKDYIKFVLRFNHVRKGLKVVIDCGNGMGGMVVPKVFEHLDCEYVPMFFELDGTFPNHEANPLKDENIKDLQKKVKKEKADIGIAIDGDADRIMFVDENGKRIPADIITILLSHFFLEKEPGATVIYDVRSSWAVKEEIEDMGGVAKKGRVGHAFLKKRVRDEKAVFAGELSGHYYIRDSFCADSGMITLLIVLSVLSKSGKTISELVKPYQRYFPSGEINSDVEDKQAMIRKLEALYSAKGENTEKIDGLTVEYKDWWFNVRPSNTEPVLRLVVEAKTKALMEEKRDEILKVIRG